jgi:IS5 family transposase
LVGRRATAVGCGDDVQSSCYPGDQQSRGGRAEFLINDRLSFVRFLGLGLSDRVPDARTIWLFREKLTKAGAIKRLFARFDVTLRQAGFITMSGQIVDASLIATPRQRNSQAAPEGPRCAQRR